MSDVKDAKSTAPPASAPVAPPPAYQQQVASPASYQLPPYSPQQPYPQQYPPQQYPTEPAQQIQPQHYPPPGSQGYYPGAATGQQQQSVIIVAPPTVLARGFHESPIQMTCPNCRNMIVTSLKYEIGGLCWLIMAILFIFGLWPCCLIPLCVPSCKDVAHSCPSCNTVLGRYKRL